MHILKNSGVIHYLFLAKFLVLQTTQASVVSNSTTLLNPRNSPFNSSTIETIHNEKATPTTKVTLISAHNFNVVSQKNYTTLLCEHKPSFRLKSGPLITYLLRLRFCQKVFDRSWLREECSQRTFSFSRYYDLVYAKFCDPKLYTSLCQRHTHIHHLVINSSLFNEKNLSSAIFTIHNISIPVDDASSGQRDSAEDQLYCKAIESYFDSLLTDGFAVKVSDSEQTYLPFYNVKYTEWFLTYRDFCYPASCGVSLRNYKNLSLTAYDCYSTQCDIAMIVDMVVDGVLAFFITTANFLVLLVAFRSAVMNNIPGYFKTSLAVADLLIGVFVLPFAIYNRYVCLFQPLPYRDEGQEPKVTDYFSQTYVNFTGIVTTVSIFTSVYTLGVASADRYLAVIHPFRYQKGKYFTRKRAILAVASVWILGFILSVIPLFYSSYTLSGVDLTIAAGFYTIVLYSSLLGFALAAMWVINIAMLFILRSQRQKSHSKKSIIKSMLFYKRPRRKSSSLSNSKDANNSSDILSYEKTIEEEKPSNQNETPEKKRASSIQKSKNLNMFGNRSSMVKAALMNENIRLALTVGIMVGTYTIALLPCILLLFSQDLLPNIHPDGNPKKFSEEAMFVYSSMEYVFVRLFLFNSFWNCIIYSIRNFNFRLALVKIFSKYKS